MLYYPKKDLTEFMDEDRIRFGDGRGEFGVCLHIPFKNYRAGSAPAEDYMLMITLANNMVEFLRYKRAVKGPEQWDYNPEQASEAYTVCGDNPNGSGVILGDTSYASGPKLQVFLDKTFGANEISIRWKNQMVGDERLLGDYEEYLKQALKTGELSPKEEDDDDEDS